MFTEPVAGVVEEPLRSLRYEQCLKGCEQCLMQQPGRVPATLDKNKISSTVRTLSRPVTANLPPHFSTCNKHMVVMSCVA
jgi:hypothetical protein